MKRFVLQIFALSFIFLTATAFAPSGGNDEAEVRIDGQVVKPEGELKFKKDDTVYLEATGIKPNSSVHIKVRKAGIAWIKDEFKVGESGEVKGVMHMPEKKMKVTCFVKYYDRDGTFHDVKFKFRTI